jgi:hypothetical protein
MKNILLLFAVISTHVLWSQTTYPSNTWLLVKDKCKIGFIDPSGKVCIAPQFEHASEFHEGLAFVWSFPGKEEDKKNVPLGEDYVNYENFNLNGNRRTGIIDTTGKYVVEPRLNFEFFSYYQNGAALVKIDKEIVFIDRKGIEITNYSHRDERLKEILRIAQVDKSLPRKYCYVDAFRISKIQSFDEVKPFSENRAAVRLGVNFGYISREGEMKIIPQFKSAGNFVSGLATVSVLIMQDNYNQQLYGVIDSLGQYVIPPIYPYLGDPSGGYVVFGINKNEERRYGLLKLSGEIVIQPTLLDAGKFSEGLFPVKGKKTYGYMDLNGKMRIKAKYKVALPFKNGVAHVRFSNGKVAIINSNGKTIWGPYENEDCKP